MTPIYGAGGVLFNSARDRVLLIRENESNGPTGRITGQLSIPMGHANQGEEFRETAEREFQEETGLRVDAAEFIGVFEIPNTQAILHAYRMRRQGNPRFIGAETLTSQWVLVRELLLLEQEGRLRAPTRQVVETAFEVLFFAPTRTRPP